MDDECLADENSAGYVERFVEAARRYAGNARGEGGTKNVPPPLPNVPPTALPTVASTSA